MPERPTQERPSLEMLRTRRSVLAKNMGEPGPTSDDIATILEVAARVPDHKKLVPWRFITLQGDDRQAFGSVLADALVKEQPDQASQSRLETERQRPLRAPTIIAMVLCPSRTDVVPEMEQTLSAGAAGMNLLNAATALGYSAQWLTEWISYSPHVAAALQLADGERLGGFFYIGTATEPPAERPRPDLSEIVTNWKA